MKTFQVEGQWYNNKGHDQQYLGFYNSCWRLICGQSQADQLYGYGYEEFAYPIADKESLQNSKQILLLLSCFG